MAKAIYTSAAGDLVQQVLERPRAPRKKTLPPDGSTTRLTLNVDTWLQTTSAMSSGVSRLQDTHMLAAISHPRQKDRPKAHASNKTMKR